MPGLPPPTNLGTIWRDAAERRQPATTEPNSDYKVEGVPNIARGTDAAGGTTTHHSGGKKATAYLGTWVRKRFLGRGARGTVYLEGNLRTAKLRAVKKLEGGNTETYDREIDQLVRVKKVNNPESIIVRGYTADSFKYSTLFVDFFNWYCDTSYNIYVAMEYHADGDLKGFIESSGPLTEAVAKAVAQQILQGVFVLHELDISHRDLKPENILIASKDPVRIKIADFGQSKIIQGSSNSVTGTPAWRAPEVGGGYYDKRADMWAVGCVVYYLLTALNPFLGYQGERDENIQKFTFHFWPRLDKHKFQEDSGRPGYRPKQGDQIVVKGISNMGNEFLNTLIILDPNQRISAHKALQNRWICQTSPLQAALENGDLLLAKLLAPHDPRYMCKWEGEISRQVSLVILRVAAASGQTGLVRWALRQLPATYEFEHTIHGWPVKPALLGAATIGSLPIVEMLIAELGSAEKTPKILLQACKGALQGGHHQVVSLIWPLLSLRDRAWDHQLSENLVRYGDSAILNAAYDHWTTHNSPRHGTELLIVRPNDPSTAYAYHFPAILHYAARHGKAEMVSWLLKMRPSPETVIPHAALLGAIEGGHCGIVKLLLESYPVAHGVPDFPLTMALVDASFYGHLDIVKCLVERGIVPSKQAIDEAVRRNNSTTFQHLIVSLIRKFKQDRLLITQYVKDAAVPHCNVALLQWLCANRPDMTFPGDPIEHVRNAARFGATETVTWFIVNTEGAPKVIAEAIIGASEGGHVAIVQRLCISTTDAEDVQAWEGAAKGGHIAILDRLLLRNRKPAKSTLRAALKAAAQVNRLASVLWLLCAGASLSTERGVIIHFKCQPVIQALLNVFGDKL